MRQEGPRHGGKGLPVQFRRGIHGDHVRRAHLAGQPRQCLPGGREALRQVQSVQHHGVIAGEVVAVVRQHAQTVFADLRIGGIDIDGVDLPVGQGFVGHAVVQPQGLLGQAVAPRQPGPAVRPAQEFMRQPEAQLRLRGQVAQRRQPELPGLVLLHGKRIGVLEAKWNPRARPSGASAWLICARLAPAGSLRISLETVPV